MRALTVPAAAAAVLFAGLAIAPPTADANPRVVTVVTGAGPVNVREGAGTNTRLLRTIPNGSRVTIVCHVRGQVFTGGPYRVSTNIWNRLDSGGYVTDAMLETGSNNPVVPVCNSAPAPAAGRTMGQTRGGNTGASGQCTWGAYQKWFEASGRRHYPALSGNAKDWAGAARATGWTVVADAQPRSIVVFQPGVHYADRTFGHVGWVDRVERRGDGVYVTITEMNYGGRVGQWSTRTVKDIPGMSYILQP
ncbi:amidase (plasmid) [Rhodococcus ruber]|nr:amidase [Rhodococcus ruber]